MQKCSTGQNTLFFQSGSRFIEIASDAICLNGKERSIRIEIDDAKNRIIDFLKENKSFYVSDIAEKMSIKPIIVIRAIKELKMEGQIADD